MELIGVIFGFWFLGALMAWAFIYGATQKGKNCEHYSEMELDDRDGEALSCKKGWHDLDSGLSRCSTGICGNGIDACEHESCAPRGTGTSNKSGHRPPGSLGRAIWQPGDD